MTKSFEEKYDHKMTVERISPTTRHEFQSGVVPPWSMPGWHMPGFDDDGHDKHRKEKPAAPINARVKLVPFEQIAFNTARRDQVKGIIPKEGIIVVWGPPKSGKSFWTFDLVMHVPLGWSYRGRRVQQGSVVYCAFEGQTGIETRCEAFRQRFLDKHQGPVPFYLQPLRLDLVRDYSDLIAAIRNQIAGDCRIVVLDTLNRSLAGSENSDEDMGAYVLAADAIREAFNCAVIIVHHCGIEGSRPRGHTSLTGACDVQIAVTRDAEGVIRTEVELAKDGPQGDVIASKLVVVEVGIDDDGEPISSCVVEPAQAASHAPGKASVKKPAPQARTFHEALISALNGKGQVREQSVWQVSVLMDEWRSECLHRGLLEDGKPDSARSLFSKNRVALIAANWICCSDNIVWNLMVSGEV